MQATEHSHGSTDVETHHEHSDVDVRGILWFLGVLLVSAVVIHVSVWGLFELFAARALQNDPVPPPLARPDLQQPPEPRLQGLTWSTTQGWITPPQELKTFRLTEDARLNGYGWVDKSAGVTRIPVERAIEIIATRGVPERPTAVQAEEAAPGDDVGSAGGTEAMTRARLGVLTFVWLVAAGVSVSSAQPGAPKPVEPASQLPAALTNIGIDQRLGEQLPADVPFKDEQGRTVYLRDFMGTKPLVLSMVYYECPMMCTQVLNGLVRALRALPSSAGRDFTIVTVSFDPTETPALAAAKKAEYLKEYGRPEAAEGWHFLTGDASSITALADAVGFRYRRDPDKPELFIHASGIMLATPDGKLARYLYGVEYTPRDLRLGLLEASEGRVGSAVDHILLFCFHYDPATGKYSILTLKLVRLGGILTVALFLGFVFVSRRTPRSDIGR